MVTKAEIRAGYKQTEVGVIPADWEIKHLGDTCTQITTGKLDANAMRPNGQYRFYTCAKDYFQIDTYAFDTEALLVSGNGANVGYIHYYKGKFNAYQRTYVLSGFLESIKYLQHYMGQKLSDRIRVEVNAGNTPYITRGTLTKMQVALPPTKAKQEAIAEVLSDADVLIESLEKLITKKRDIKQGTMQELLTGKKRLPGFEIKPGTKQTEVGVIPEDWEVKKCAEVGSFYKGKGISSKDLVADGLPCIMYGDIYVKFDTKFSNPDFRITEQTASNSSLARTGDLFFTGSGETAEEIGKCVVYQGEGDIYIGGDIIAMTPNSDNDSLFLAYMQNSMALMSQKANLGQGHTVVHIYTDHVKSLKIPLPPTKAEQTAIAQVLSDMDTEIQQWEEKRDKYKLIKQGMMQELLTGKTRLV